MLCGGGGGAPISWGVEREPCWFFKDREFILLVIKFFLTTAAIISLIFK